MLYDAPLLSAQQMSLWEWIASYYMCSLGEVMRVALPALMKPSGDTEEEFSGDEFRPRTECYVSLAAELRDEGRFHEVCEKIERRAPKQYEALLELAAAGDETRIATGEVARRLLRADYAVLHALERKKYIVCTQRERSVERGGSAFRLPELTAHQLTALNALREQFAAGKTTALLQGVTGSGKTEIYIHLIAEVLSRGGDVLLLVPEIALTAQLIERMERIFGSRVTPYHSKLTNRRRTETYLRLNRSDGGEFVVGVRSSVFLPLKHLQLIVVDEEHDASYKQTEPAPRYNARDCAVVMARLTGGRTLLGSATPSLETWLNAASGKYGRAELTQRYGDARPPEILVSDTLRAARRGERKGHFNKLLLDRIGETLDRGGQVMLFQNRRGFSPYVACSECGWTQRACGAADAQRPADAVAGFAGAAGVGETAHSGFEVLFRAGRAGAGVDEGQLLEGAAVLGDIPGLVAGMELLHGAFRLDPDGDDEVGALDAVPELRADVGHGAARAAVGVLAALLGVDRALQGAAALFVAEGVEVAVGGQAVADGVEDGGLAHGVDADHIGQPGAVEGHVLKVVPVDELQAFQFYHSSTSTAAVPSSGRS